MCRWRVGICFARSSTEACCLIRSHRHDVAMGAEIGAVMRRVLVVIARHEIAQTDTWRTWASASRVTAVTAGAPAYRAFL